MKSIYGSATVVRMWLGEDADGSSDMIWLLEQIAQGITIGKLRRDNVFGQKDLWNLIAFLERLWWSRVWVLQEAILAKEVTIHCGRKFFSDSTFSNLLRKLHERFYYRHAPK